MMKILVFVKPVKGEISPFDEAALETALRMKDRTGCEVIAAAMAPEGSCDRMRALTRVGVDRSVLISDAAFAGSDTAATSYVLSLAARKLLGISSDKKVTENTFLILCGRQSLDGDTAQVGPSVADRLGIPALTCVMSLDVADGRADCVTRLGNESVTLPALLTVERIAPLRFPSIRARARETERLDAAALGADRRLCGLTGSPTKVLRTFECTSDRRHCEFLDADAFVGKLLELMKAPDPRLAAVQPENPENTGKKLNLALAVGEEAAKVARGVAEEVITLEKGLSADDYVRVTRERDPDALFFASDIWGRRIAPVVATRLSAGLCADCTRLESDGERLFMYRPALGGNITAKIVSRARPAMATVRTVTAGGDIVFSRGLGLRDELSNADRFAAMIGAEKGASRGLVDAGLAPYSEQVGLTGRNVSPKIYLAAGISGAVHHTVGISSSGWVLAVNPDRSARIFDACDYGFSGEFGEFLRKFSSYTNFT